MLRDRRRLSILALGNIEIRTDTGSVVAALPKSQRRLIGVLAAAEGDSVSLGRLIEVLQISKPALQTTVSRIRTAAGDETITTAPDGYALGDADLDTTRFRDLVAAAADMLPHDRETTLREALGLWRGGPFVEFADEDWARTAAVRLHELHAAAIEDHAEALLDIGRVGESAGADASAHRAPSAPRSASRHLDASARNSGSRDRSTARRSRAPPPPQRRVRHRTVERVHRDRALHRLG